MNKKDKIVSSICITFMWIFIFIFAAVAGHMKAMDQVQAAENWQPHYESELVLHEPGWNAFEIENDKGERFLIIQNRLGDGVAITQIQGDS